AMATLGTCPMPSEPKQVWIPLVTSLFLHGNLAHLLGNLLFLVVFGDNVEARLGHLRFLGFYLAGGIAATLAFVVLQAGSAIPLVGASGAIAAILGAYAICFPRARVHAIAPFPLYLLALVLPGVRITRWLLLFAVVALPAWLMLGGWFVLQALALRETFGAVVAYEAHVAGFVAGIALVLLLDRRRVRHHQPAFHPGRRS
ncbi:MAG: rhomboid family intramembrane serine protease, partial [Actinomycetota bacterium]